MEDAGRVAAMQTSFAMHQLAHTHNLKVFNLLFDPTGLPPVDGSEREGCG